MRSLVLFSVAMGLALFSATGAFATPITFTGGNLNAGDLLNTPYIEAGYSLTRSGGVSANINAPAAPFGSNFLLFQEPAVITLARQDLAAFNLNSFDFSALLGTNLSVVGNLFGGGGSVILPLIGSGGLDSTGPLGAVWTNLASVVFSNPNLGSGAAIGLDNINVDPFSAPPAAVPEPATASLLGLGTMIGAFCQYRRRKRSV